jgi:uncharacterized protein (TIGR02453 family)
MSQIQKTTLKFLRDLEAHNDRIWFEANRVAYEAARANFIEFTGDIITRLAKFEPAMAALDPKKAVFRIYRDVRFSKNKDPYKTNFGASLGMGPKSGLSAGYYLQIQPGNASFAAAGAYMPEPAVLSAMRQEIDYNLPAFERIMKAAAFRKHFDGLDEIEVLKTTPKGYAPENPALPYLRHKSYVVSHAYTDKEVLDPGFIKQVEAALKAAHPFITFLNKAGD